MLRQTCRRTTKVHIIHVTVILKLCCRQTQKQQNSSTNSNLDSSIVRCTYPLLYLLHILFGTSLYIHIRTPYSLKCITNTSCSHVMIISSYLQFDRILLYLLQYLNDMINMFGLNCISSSHLLFRFISIYNTCANDSYQPYHLLSFLHTTTCIIYLLSHSIISLIRYFPHHFTNTFSYSCYAVHLVYRSLYRHQEPLPFIFKSVTFSTHYI